jgi:hypothetical protein
MRFWGFAFAVLTGTLSVSLSLVAQHTVAPLPPVSPAISHVAPMPSTPSTAMHAASVPSSRMPGASSTTGAHGVPSAAKPVHNLKATGVTGKGQLESAAHPSPERRGLFSFLRKREPVPPDSPDKCKDDRRSANFSIPPTPLVASAPWVAPHLPRHLSCIRVPTNNPAIPCNLVLPCCYED